MTPGLLTPHMRVFATLVLVGLLVWVANLVRHRRLSLRDSLLWVVSTGGALLVTVFPGILVWIARLLQIEVASNALFALSFVYVLVNLLSLTMVVSRSAVQIRRLTQECAMLRAELERLRGGPAPRPPEARSGPLG